MNRESKLPSINVPVGPYTAYEAEVGKDGYRIKYRANDPLVMRVERDSNTKDCLGLGKTKLKPLNSTRWTVIHTRPNSSSTTITEGKGMLIKAIGRAENTGRLVGSSVGASVAPSVANIPIIGWVLMVG